MPRWRPRAIYEDGNLRLSLVAHDREEYDRYYNVFANPTLWFIHHYLWGLAMEPDVDRNIRLAWDAGYLPVNERFAEAVAAEIEDSADDSPVVMVHDYQLFMVPRGVRERVPRALHPALHAHPLADARLLADPAR